jgi:hypothetical protein
MLEKQAVQIIRDALTNAGCRWVRKNHGNMYSVGRTDLEALSARGRFAGLEVKARPALMSSKTTPLQWAEIAAINAAGGFACSCALSKEGRGGNSWYIQTQRRRESQPESEPLVQFCIRMANL